MDLPHFPTPNELYWVYITVDNQRLVLTHFDEVQCIWTPEPRMSREQANVAAELYVRVNKSVVIQHLPQSGNTPADSNTLDPPVLIRQFTGFHVAPGIWQEGPNCFRRL